MSEIFTQIVTMVVREDKRERSEEIWRKLVDDIELTGGGKISFNVYRDDEEGKYIVVEEFESQKAMEAFTQTPFHLEMQVLVKDEGLLAGPPQIKTVKKIQGTRK